MALKLHVVVLELTLFSATLTHASRVKETSGVATYETYESMKACQEANVEADCICEHSSKKGYQCSGCKDPTKWGYGCRLNCPAACKDSCDFAGNCGKCPGKCKRNGRSSNKSPEDVCLNEHGLCQACQDGFYGLMCDGTCPKNCHASKAEGKCKRDGECYSCELGWYGSMCDKECPKACPKCMQFDGKDDSGLQMPAGSCNQACKGDTWGTDCGTPCPTHCDRSGLKQGQASCTRDEGKCHNCEFGWWGDKCDQACSAHCVDGKCARNGFCTKGCKNGFWGPLCTNQCPEFTVIQQGCDRDTGKPNACDATHYVKNNACASCPSGCLDKECTDDGICSKGCEEGFFGDICTMQCPEHCVGGCDRANGKCNACAKGKTGPYCKDTCHSSCSSCTQYTGGSALALALTTRKPGNTEKDCLSCPADEPSMLASAEGPATCDCIRGAHRPDKDARCTCDSPSDKFMEPFFEKQPKKCGFKCKEDYEGKELRSVYSRAANKHKCIFLDMEHAVILASVQNKGTVPNKGMEPCASDEYAIDVDGTGKSLECLHEDFVKYILGGK